MGTAFYVRLDKKVTADVVDNSLNFNKLWSKQVSADVVHKPWQGKKL